ncbi:MAG: YjhX family toxin [Alphaproteobacteria bacterium]
MNISKDEQRVLHALAQGGLIKVEKNEKNKIIKILCFNRDGWVLTHCTMIIFNKLRKKGLVASKNSLPYRITSLGIRTVRAQLDNR